MYLKTILEKLITDESKKNKIMIGIAAVCFILAGITTCAHFSDNNVSLEDSDYEKIWVKCKNPNCETEYQMERDEYFMMTELNSAPESETYTHRWSAPVFSTSCYESISHIFSLSWGRRSVAEPCSRHLAANAAGAV